MGKTLASLMIMGAFFLALASFLVYVYSKRKYPLKNADCIIVLGAKIHPDGSPSNTLKYRLDAAITAYRQNRAAVIIVTGGQGPDENEPEACAMKRYLIQKGIPANCIHEETQSKNTIENLKNACVIMSLSNLKTAVIATTDYHMPRARLIAKRLGVKTSAAPSRPGRRLVTQLTAYSREVLSWGLLIIKIAQRKI
ncbi:MAG: YdcF family protein [Clostridia bacterium]|nr:YdcF family protein [Clostridia bacterium]